MCYLQYLHLLKPKIMSGEVMNMPHHYSADWEFFHNNGNAKIGDQFDVLRVTNRSCPVRITNVYDLSHFWIVFDDEELNVFHKYLHQFYSQYEQFYKIDHVDLELGMYCVVYTEDAYYRGRLLNIPIFEDEAKNTEDIIAMVYLIDFGYFSEVPLKYFYVMTRAMYSVTSFAVRAVLAGLGPANGNSWSTEAVKKFQSLIYDKVFYATTVGIWPSNKALFVTLTYVNDETESYECISDMFIKYNFARFVDQDKFKRVQERRKSDKHEAPVTPSYLKPTFDELENGHNVKAYNITKFLNSFRMNH